MLVPVVLLGLPGSAPLHAEEFSLNDLNPFQSREQEVERQTDYSQRYPVANASRRAGPQSPSLWTRMGDDLRRLNNGTKRALANTADALCWKNWGKSSSPPPSRTSTHTWRTPSTPKQSNNSWFTPFWSREEPKGPQTPQDFVGMERPRM
ncbi:MAG: hypothetical protein ACOCWL_00970 [Thermoguttaceae bacterium]